MVKETYIINKVYSDTGHLVPIAVTDDLDLINKVYPNLVESYNAIGLDIIISTTKRYDNELPSNIIRNCLEFCKNNNKK